MSPNISKKLKSLVLICAFASFSGVIYELIDEKVLDERSVLVGFPLGFGFGILELFLFPKAERWFRKWSFTSILVFKALLYTAVITFIVIIIMIISGLNEGRQFKELWIVLGSASQLILIGYTLVVYVMLLFILQVNRLLGEGILWKFITGKYHRPREEARIFMFLDMKSSTTIAEKLGHVRFYALLNELFHEISEPALQTKAEIYQYVGDEVVLTWEVKDGLENSNCLKTFFMFRDILIKKSESYQKNFGVIPEFKAGLHFGKVIAAQIGDLKREIVYNGDVLNTTARIRSECNTYRRDCLVSGMLKSRLIDSESFSWEKMNTVALKGKETEVEIFSVNHI